MAPKLELIKERVLKRDMVFAVAILIVLSLLMWGTLPLSSVKTRMVGLMAHSGADSCSIGRIALTPRLTVEIKNLYYRSRINGVETILEAPRVQVSVRSLKLATRLIARQRANPAPSLFATATTPLIPLQQRAIDSLLNFAAQFQIKRVEADKIRLTSVLSNGCRLHSESVTLALQTSFGRTLKIKGSVAATAVSINKTVLNAVRCPVVLDDGILKIGRITAEGYGGTVTAALNADLRRMRLESGDFRLKKVNLERWYDSAGTGVGTLKGQAECSFSFEPSPLVFDSLRGTGTLTATRIMAEKLPAQRDLMVLIVLPQLAKIHFKKLGTDLRLTNGRVYTDRIEGVGNDLEMQGQGYVTLSGTCNEQLKLILSAAALREVAPLLRKSLDSEPDGRSSFKCRVSGTFASPRIEVDERIMNRAVNNVFEGIQKGFRDLLN